MPQRDAIVSFVGTIGMAGLVALAELGVLPLEVYAPSWVMWWVFALLFLFGLLQVPFVLKTVDSESDRARRIRMNLGVLLLAGWVGLGNWAAFASHGLPSSSTISIPFLGWSERAAPSVGLLFARLITIVFDLVFLFVVVKGFRRSRRPGRSRRALDGA